MYESDRLSPSQPVRYNGHKEEQVAETETEAPDTESPEAQARKTIDSLKSKVSDLERQLDASRKTNTVERMLRKNDVPEEEFGSRIELLAPHLPEIPLDGLEEALSSDKFKPLVSTSTSSNGDSGDEPPADNTPSEPEGGFGSQPSPGGDHQPVVSGQVGPGDDEYDAAYEAARKGDHSKMEKLYADGRVKEPTRTW